MRRIAVHRSHTSQLQSIQQSNSRRQQNTAMTTQVLTGKVATNQDIWKGAVLRCRITADAPRATKLRARTSCPRCTGRLNTQDACTTYWTRKSCIIFSRILVPNIHGENARGRSAMDGGLDDQDQWQRCGLHAAGAAKWSNCSMRITK